MTYILIATLAFISAFVYVGIAASGARDIIVNRESR